MTVTWQDGVAKALLTGSPPLLLVPDPDGVLLDEEVERTLAQHGYDLISYEDPVHFRVSFESRYSVAIENEAPDTRLVVRIGQAEAEHFPYDLLQLGELRTVPSWQEATALGSGGNQGVADSQIDEAADRLNRLDAVLTNVRGTIPASDSSFTAWLSYARAWADLQRLRYSIRDPLPPPLSRTIAELELQLDQALLGWALSRYASLYNQPTIGGPVMVHHVPRFLARHLETDSAAKVAVIIIDGLALSQWLVLQKVLQGQLPPVQWIESALFAWMPTLTPVSRQAMLAGQIPHRFAESLQHTNREEALWQQFWRHRNIPASRVYYQRGMGQPSDLRPLGDALQLAPYRVAALIINTVDDIMHGMQLGMAGMLNQVKQWAEQGYLARLLELLLQRGWRVFLTSDHGNIEANGIGSPREGAAAEIRGERVRVYRDEIILRQVNADFPETVMWPTIGLPENYHPLLAPSRKAFGRGGSLTVGHGGLSIEELVVPFAEIRYST